MTPQERYTKANEAHLAVAAEIGRIRPRRDADLSAMFDLTHEARRLAFLDVLAEMRRSA